MTDHERPTTDSRALTEVLGERARQDGAGSEPTTEELVAHLEGRLSDDEAAALERRLAASPEATRDLLDLAELMEVEESLARDDDAPADLEVEKGWRDFHRRRGRLDGDDASGAVGRGPSRSSGPVVARYAGVAAVAAVAVAALALGVWIGGLGLDPGGSDAPAVLEGVGATATLFADRSGQGATVELAPGERALLTLDPGERCPEYRVEIDGAGDAGSLTGLTRDPSGSLVVLFAGEPGAHRVRILGCQPERELAIYQVDVVAPGR